MKLYGKLNYKLSYLYYGKLFGTEYTQKIKQDLKNG